MIEPNPSTHPDRNDPSDHGVGPCSSALLHAVGAAVLGACMLWSAATRPRRIVLGSARPPRRALA
jgi:hypothetical protein